MPKTELHGALLFSKDHPQITGWLVIDGIEYEIAGWHASEIRSEITARKRGAVAIQGDMFDATSRTGES